MNALADPRIAAYEMGYHAGVNGKSAQLCPFPKMTVEWTTWNEAHNHGASIHNNVVHQNLRSF